MKFAKTLSILFLMILICSSCVTTGSTSSANGTTSQPSVGDQVLSGVGTVLSKANYFLTNEAPIMAGICSGKPTGDLATACSVYSLAQAGTAIGAANVKMLQQQAPDPAVQTQLQTQTAALAQNIEVLNQAAKVDGAVSAQKVVTAAPPPVKVEPIAGTSPLPAAPAPATAQK
jgi:hypothetical protein